MTRRGAQFAIIVLYFALAAIFKLEPSARVSGAALGVNFVAYLVAWHLALLAHELAHAFAAKAVGLRPFVIDVGYGQPVVQRLFAGMLLIIRPIPSSGVTLLAAPSARHARKRLFVAIAAGPLCSIALAGASLLAAAPSLSDVRTRPVPLAMFFAANALVALSLLPFPASKAQAGEAPGTDGWQMLTVGFRSAAAVQQIVQANDVADAVIAMRQEKWAEARAACAAVLARKPGHLTASLVLASVTLSGGDHARARELYESLLDRPDAKAIRAVVQNNLAWTYVLLRDPALIGEADRLSSEALRTNPRSGPFLGTRGAVLLELGKLEDAISLLRSAWRQNERRNRAANECCLAMARSRLGNIGVARRHLRAAERLNPSCALLARARSECGLG